MNKLLSPVMYSKSWNNKLLFWQLTIHHQDNRTTITKTHGYLGSKPINDVEVKNERLDTSQCNVILLKLVSKKRNNGYRSLSDLGIKDDTDITIQLNAVLTANKFDTNDTAKPMKAKPFKTGVMDYPCFIQPKLNGVRCIISKTEKDNGLFGKEITISIRSKEGIEYNVNQVKEDAEKLLANASTDMVLDGELYYHGVPSTTIAGAARNMDNRINHKMYFVVFDLAVPDLDQSERLRYVKELFNSVKPLDYIELIETSVINSDEEAVTHAETFIKDGYEGAIIRDMLSPYYFGGRRNNMLKIKKYKTGRFLILDVVAWDKNPDIGVFVCKNDISSDTFNCNAIATNEQRMEYLRNKYKYVGRYAMVKYYERTINMLPFHANILEIL